MHRPTVGLNVRFDEGPFFLGLPGSDHVHRAWLACTTGSLRLQRLWHGMERWKAEETCTKLEWPLVEKNM